MFAFGLALWLATAAPAVATFPTGFPGKAIFQLKPSRVTSCGNLRCGWVRLDGYGLFEVVAPAVRNAPDADTDTDIDASIRERIALINSRLEQLVRLVRASQRHVPPADRDRDLDLEIGTLNGQTVIFAPDQPIARQIAIATVTRLDAQYQGRSEAVVAETWRNTILDAIARAVAEREPDYLRAQAFVAAQVQLTCAAIALLLSWLSRKLLRHRHNLRDRQQAIASSTIEMEAEAAEVQEVDGATAAGSDDNGDRDVPFSWQVRRQLVKGTPWFTQQRQLSLVFFAEWALRWLRIFLFFFGLTWVLLLFPQTRASGIELAEKPLALLLIWLGAGGAIALSHRLIEKSLRLWVENQCQTVESFERYALRVPTYSTVLYRAVWIVAFAIAIAFSLEVIGVPTRTLLASAGIIVAALTFGAQGIVKDVISGSLILITDQYAVGDFIVVGDASGLVESINLYVTQIRSPDGDLISIPNGSVGTVANRSKEWARVNFTIELAYDSDVDRALELLTEVAEDLRRDPDWQGCILRPAQVLGVDEIRHSGLLVRVWIDTPPLRQWPVGREYRRRVKLAMDAAGIAVGIPQQSFLYRDGTPSARRSLPPVRAGGDRGTT